MPSHKETRLLPYTPEQLFELVINFQYYPEFLPWCLAARVLKAGPDFKEGELVVGNSLLRESFHSMVRFERPYRIDMHYDRGPLKHLNGHWLFEKVDGGTRVDFFVDFEMKSGLLQKMISHKLEDAILHMVGAFEKRAADLYLKP